MSWPLFYTVVVAFFVAMFTIISLPWLRGRNQKSIDQIRNAQIVKQRLEELEREATEGLISEKDKQQAVTELKLALVEESHISVSSKPTRSYIPLSLGLILALGIGGVVYYNGNHISEVKQLVDATESVEALSAKLIGVVEGQSDISPAELQSLTLAIRQRLRDTPNDEQAWLNLGRLYMSIGFSEQSIESFKRAFELAPENPSMRLSYAQALMLSGTDENLQRSQRMLEFELEQQPENDNIKLMLTVVTSQLGDLGNAERYFSLIRDKMSPDTQMYQTLVARLQELRQQQGISESEQGEQQTGFKVTVNVDEAIKEKLPEQGFLFVFAQDAKSSMKMPAAVIKLPLQALPITVSLTEDNAMMPNFTLNQLEQTNLVARVSLDENVETAMGELQGSTLENVIKGQVVISNILINKEIQ